MHVHEMRKLHPHTINAGAALVVQSVSLGPASASLSLSGRLQCTLLYSSHELGGGMTAAKHVASLAVEGDELALGVPCWFIG